MRRDSDFVFHFIISQHHLILNYHIYSLENYIPTLLVLKKFNFFQLIFPPRSILDELGLEYPKSHFLDGMQINSISMTLLQTHEKNRNRFEATMKRCGPEQHTHCSGVGDG